MADGDSSSNTSVVAIVAIFLIVLIAGFFAWQKGMFGGHRAPDTRINVELNSPKPTENPAPVDQPH